MACEHTEASCIRNEATNGLPVDWAVGMHRQQRTRVSLFYLIMNGLDFIFNVFL